MGGGGGKVLGHRGDMALVAGHWWLGVMISGGGGGWVIGAVVVVVVERKAIRGETCHRRHVISNCWTVQ